MDDQASGGREKGWSEKHWHEEAPRIIASGRWEQDEYGDTTYIPDHVRPSTAERAEAPPPDDDDAPRGHYYEDPALRDGYRVRSEATWAAARRDYLAGDTAEAVCDRYGLKLGTLRSRAAREGWRRCDAGDPDLWPDDDDPVEDAAADAPDLAAMAAQALMRQDQLSARARDVVEHIDRVLRHAQRMEQTAETAVQIHFSAQGNRTNDIMLVLTTITAIFLPLNLITGVFGMNFRVMPLLDHVIGFWIAIISMVLIALGMGLWFWRKRYLAALD